MKIFWWLMVATDCGVAIQFLYWAALEVGYWLNLTSPAQPTHLWLFFAFGNSVFYWVWNVRRDLKKCGIEIAA